MMHVYDKTISLGSVQSNLSDVIVPTIVPFDFGPSDITAMRADIIQLCNAMYDLEMRSKNGSGFTQEMLTDTKGNFRQEIVTSCPVK
jgi:hypothetical protein